MAKGIEIKGINDFIDDWNKATKAVDTNKKSLTELLMIQTKINAEFSKNSSLKELIRLQEKLRIERERQKNGTDKLSDSQKKLEQATKQLAIAQSKESIAIQETRVETQRLNKENKLTAQSNLGLIGSYKKLSLELNKNRQLAKDAAITYGTNSKQFRVLAKEVRVADAKLKAIDKTLGQGQRTVGLYGTAFRNLASSLGLVGGATAFVGILRSSFNIIKDFNKQQAVTAGILGVTRSEISALTEDAKRLGSTTAFTASEVSGLQESYARLGFTQQEILASTEATLNGALALQSDLGATAELVGSTLNQFGLDAEQSSRVVDVLSKSTQISALNFERLSTALPIVGKTAQIAGVSIEETAALLGVLANNGIDASSSATALRNIYLKSNKAGLTFNEALEKINNSTNKLNTAQTLFGVKGATVALTLAENSAKTEEFTVSLNNSAGAAQNLADEQLNTLDGSLKLLNSAWEGFILGADGSSGASEKLTVIIKFLADNLNAIFNVIGTVIGGFTAYKVALKLASIQSSLLTAKTALTTTAVTASGAAAGKSASRWTLLNNAIKANLLGIAVVAITALVFAFQKYNKTLDETVKETEESTNAFLKQKEESESLTNNLSSLVDRYKELSKNTKRSTAEQAELDKIMKQIAKDVPNAAGEIDKYGNILSINTDKTQDFIDRQKELIALDTEAQLSKNREVLERLTEKQEGFNKILDGTNSVNVDGIGIVRQLNGEYQKLVETGRSGSSFVPLTNDEVISFTKNAKKINEQIFGINENISQLDGSAERDRLRGAQGRFEAKQAAEKLKAEEEANEKSIENAKKANASAKKEADKLAKQQAKDLEALTLFRISQNIKANQEILKNDEESFGKRLLANEQLVNDQIELINKRKEFDLQKATTNDGRKLIELKAAAEIEKIREQSGERINDITLKYIQEQKDIVKDANDDKVNAIQEAGDLELDALKEQFLKNNITVEELANEEKEIKARIGKEILAQKIKDLEAELLVARTFGIITEAQEEAISKNITALKREQLDIQVSDKQEATEKELEEQKKQEDALKESYKNIAAEFGISGESFDAAFSLIKDGFKDIEDEGERFAKIFEAVGSVVTGVFGSIVDASNQALESRIEDVEREREAVLENANLTNEQREFLEEKYDAKKRDLQRKQAQNDKSLALLNAFVNTAAGVTKALATLNIPLAISIGVLGAVQIAKIASTPIPEFWTGTENAPEGIARVGERGAEIITDSRGNFKELATEDSLTYLKKGDKVFNADKTKNIMDGLFDRNTLLNSISLNEASLNAGNVNVNVQSKGISKKEMEVVMTKAMSKHKSTHVNMDRNGYTKYIKRGGTNVYFNR